MIKFLVSGAGKLRPVATVSSHHQCQKICQEGAHIGGKVYQGASLASINGLPIARVGDKAHCLVFHDAIKEGVSNFLIQNRQVATVGCKTDHHGVITTGCESHLIGERLPLKKLLT